jgi:hypothetical protein
MTTQVHALSVTLRALLEGAIDYAGLFAPASLDMTASVNNYARYREHPQSWALGRFVLPVARLDEFLNARAKVRLAGKWRLSGIVSGNVETELKSVEDFNRMEPGAVVDAIEARVSNMDDIDRVRQHEPAGTTVFYEIAPEQADELLPILRHIGGKAKLRTGGVVEDAIPAVEQVAGFVARCAELRVPFKATAGLHHPLRCVHALTYAAESPVGMMHGFLNLFTAAALAWNAAHSGGTSVRETLATCLGDGERAHWHFGDDALNWSGAHETIRVDAAELRTMRSQFALSFGSCSFEEPIEELHGLGLL